MSITPGCEYEGPFSLKSNNFHTAFLIFLLSFPPLPPFSCSEQGRSLYKNALYLTLYHLWCEQSPPWMALTPKLTVMLSCEITRPGCENINNHWLTYSKKCRSVSIQSPLKPLRKTSQKAVIDNHFLAYWVNHAITISTYSYLIFPAVLP